MVKNIKINELYKTLGPILFGIVLALPANLAFGSILMTDLEGDLGVILPYNSILLPVGRGSIPIEDRWLLDGTVGSVVSAGLVEIGIRYKIPSNVADQIFLGIKTGLTYSLVDTSFYNAAGAGYRYKKFSIEGGGMTYYREFYKHSTSSKPLGGAYVSILFHFDHLP